MLFSTNPTPVFSLVLSLILISILGCKTARKNTAGEIFQQDASKNITSSTLNYLSNNPMIGKSCRTNDRQTLCLGLKYVVYKNSKGSPLLSQQAAIQNISTINRLWAQCKIAFQIDEYLPVEVENYALKPNTSTYAELDSIRKTFDDQQHILIVTTGRWDRTGNLGNTGANAWTTMPGEDLAGVVIEAPVSAFGNIVAHELGHYLSLNHASNATNVMNPIIYDRSIELNSTQCNAARSAVNTYWQNMLR